MGNLQEKGFFSKASDEQAVVDNKKSSNNGFWEQIMGFFSGIKDFFTGIWQEIKSLLGYAKAKSALEDSGLDSSETNSIKKEGKAVTGKESEETTNASGSGDDNEVDEEEGESEIDEEEFEDESDDVSNNKNPTVQPESKADEKEVDDVASVHSEVHKEEDGADNESNNKNPTVQQGSTDDAPNILDHNRSNTEVSLIGPTHNQAHNFQSDDGLSDVLGHLLKEEG